ncbi:MAG: hypothetical protein ABIN18_23805 [Pseudomonadota bacterium]
MLKKCFLFMMMTAFLISAPSISSSDSNPPYDEEKLIEVCIYGIVQVPRDTKYVKCYGKVYKVVKIVEYTGESKASCRCPTCCDGLCYIIITCPVSPKNQQNSKDGCGCNSDKKATSKDGVALCELWVSC